MLSPYFCFMEHANPSLLTGEKLSFDNFRNEVLNDFRIACISRETSLLGRKEVLTGKAKFGIFGDGKEIAQVAMAKVFKNGDFRSGYYRDQTFMFAAGLSTVEQFFSQLYADPELNHDPFSAGRQMNSHFATKFIDEEGTWLDLVNMKNISADVGPTAGQMPRGLGLAFASKSFRHIPELKQFNHLSNNGNEVCFVTIGDASTSEGHFWETINAAGVLQVPMAVFVWDDGYGISVPKEYQTVKASISEALQGMQKTGNSNGIYIYKVKGWDYAGMCEVFEEGIALARETHTPVLFHVDEMTQPQGHSTSGSHERYKNSERLEWEKEWDGIKKMKEWIIENALATREELEEISENAKSGVREGKAAAFHQYLEPIREQVTKTVELIGQHAVQSGTKGALDKIIDELKSIREPLRRDVLRALYNSLNLAGNLNTSALEKYYRSLLLENQQRYNSLLYNEGPKSALKVPVVAASFDEN